jgi:hypothetical protein
MYAKRAVANMSSVKLFCKLQNNFTPFSLRVNPEQLYTTKQHHPRLANQSICKQSTKTPTTWTQPRANNITSKQIKICLCFFNKCIANNKLFLFSTSPRGSNSNINKRILQYLVKMEVKNGFLVGTGENKNDSLFAYQTKKKNIFFICSEKVLFSAKSHFDLLPLL